jgi:hypothetical protein
MPATALILYMQTKPYWVNGIPQWHQLPICISLYQAGIARKPGELAGLFPPMSARPRALGSLPSLPSPMPATALFLYVHNVDWWVGSWVGWWLDRWVSWLVRRSVDGLVGGWVGRLVGWSIGWWVSGCGYMENASPVRGNYTDLNRAHRTSSAERAGAAHC